MTYLMRTAALKEKARDYIAASRVIGASTRDSFPSPPPKLCGHHRDLGSVFHFKPCACPDFSGLSWFWLARKIRHLGTALRDGLENLSAPWLVKSGPFLFWLAC